VTFLTPHSEIETIETVLLLASEIVANAVQHGMPPHRLVAELNDGLIRVGVSDGSPAALPQRQHPEDHEQHGRGLAFVEALADRWGADTTSQHKTVWFELTNR
jgi:hypothetical protein